LSFLVTSRTLFPLLFLIDSQIICRFIDGTGKAPSARVRDGEDHLSLQLLGKVSRGGRGVVYWTQYTNSDRIVAPGTLPKDLLGDEEVKTRFVHEAKTTSVLNHLNVAAISDTNEVKSEWSIYTEHVEKRIHRTLEVLGLKYL
jgi:hypothetical protein